MKIVLAGLPREWAYIAPALHTAPVSEEPLEEWPGELWLDSGGYQLLTGRRVSFSKLASAYSSVRAEVKFSLDFPPAPEDGCATARQKEAASYAAYAMLSQKVDVAPIVHVHKCLDPASLAARLYPSAKLVGLGSAVPYVSRLRKFDLVLSAVRSLAELGYKVHVFGLAAPSLVPKLREAGAYSSDSTNWKLKAAYGKVVLPWGGERHVTDRDFKFGGRRAAAEELARLYEFLKATGFPELDGDFASRLKDRKYRMLVNAWAVSRVQFLEKFSEAPWRL